MLLITPSTFEVRNHVMNRFASINVELAVHSKLAGTIKGQRFILQKTVNLDGTGIARSFC